jgi:hypothetical protein
MEKRNILYFSTDNLDMSLKLVNVFLDINPDWSWLSEISSDLTMDKIAKQIHKKGDKKYFFWAKPKPDNDIIFITSIIVKGAG